MLSVVCWKWGTLYSVEYVNRLRSMLERHLHIPHTLWCVTDNADGMDNRIEGMPMFPDTFPGMTSPSGKRANFRRLRTFDASLASIWGPRILMLDIDIVITGDVTPLFSRTEPLLAFDQRHNTARHKYNTSVVLMDTGVLGHMWTEFKADPGDVWEKVKRSSIGDGNNSDQAVFGYYATRYGSVTGIGPDDGVTPFYKVKNQDGGGLPPNTRAVLFFGSEKPAESEIQKICPWILQHWW
jgi:hypothetical protein